MTKNHSIETKQLISQKLKDRWKDPDFRKKMLERLNTDWSEHYKERSEKITISYTPERRKEYSERMKERWKNADDLMFKNKCKHPAWKGDKAKYEAIHIRMRKLHLQDKCQWCGVTQEELKKNNKRGLAIHCKSDNIYNSNKSNWMTLCTGCHQRIHRPPIVVSKERKERQNGSKI